MFKSSEREATVVEWLKRRAGLVVKKEKRKKGESLNRNRSWERESSKGINKEKREER